MENIIKINISEDEVVNSLEMKKLYEYLEKKGHDVIPQKKIQSGTKGELITSLTFVISLYPLIKDIFNYCRPRQQYGVSVSNGITTYSKSNLTEEEFLEEIENLEEKGLEIRVSKD